MTTRSSLWHLEPTGLKPRRARAVNPLGQQYAVASSPGNRSVDIVVAKSRSLVLPILSIQNVYMLYLVPYVMRKKIKYSECCSMGVIVMEPTFGSDWFGMFRTVVTIPSSLVNITLVTYWLLAVAALRYFDIFGVIAFDKGEGYAVVSVRYLSAYLFVFRDISVKATKRFLQIFFFKTIRLCAPLVHREGWVFLLFIFLPPLPRVRWYRVIYSDQIWHETKWGSFQESTAVGLASHWPCVTDISGSPHTVSSPVRGCKNRPAPFPGRISYKATKTGYFCFIS